MREKGLVGGKVMLTEKRQKEILKLLGEKGSVTVQELTEKLNASESTIRRDLTLLHQKGELVKVFGGAVQTESRINIREEKVALRKELKKEEKIRIARYAASLVEPDDFVYLDAGTTTEYMIPFLTEKSAVFVTNAVSHALQLTENGFRVILIGGELKAATEAIVGNEAYVNLQKYNFTKGFFGTNGADRKFGYTTPDPAEAMIKETAMKKCRKCYVLADSTKIGHTAPVKFGNFSDAWLITTNVKDKELKKEKNIIEVRK